VLVKFNSSYRLQNLRNNFPFSNSEEVELWRHTSADRHEITAVPARSIIRPGNRMPESSDYRISGLV
jgi:hypothetical protein